MKRYRDLWTQIIDFENLIQAARQAQQGKRFRPSVLAFNLVGVDSPLLCGEEDRLQSEALGSAADPIPYPVCLQRGS